MTPGPKHAAHLGRKGERTDGELYDKPAASDGSIMERKETRKRKTITTESRQQVGKCDDLRPDASAFPDKDTTDPSPGRAAAAAAAAAAAERKEVQGYIMGFVVSAFNL